MPTPCWVFVPNSVPAQFLIPTVLLRCGTPPPSPYTLFQSRKDIDEVSALAVLDSLPPATPVFFLPFSFRLCLWIGASLLSYGSRCSCYRHFIYCYYYPLPTPLPPFPLPPLITPHQIRRGQFAVLLPRGHVIGARELALAQCPNTQVLSKRRKYISGHVSNDSVYRIFTIRVPLRFPLPPFCLYFLDHFPFFFLAYPDSYIYLVSIQSVRCANISKFTPTAFSRLPHALTVHRSSLPWPFPVSLNFPSSPRTLISLAMIMHSRT